MSRVKRGVTARQRHNKVLKAAKGYKHGRKNIFRLAKQALLKAGVFAYRDRKVKKRTNRAHWIVVLNAAVRQHDMSYSAFMNGLKKADIDMNRRVLAELAEFHPEEFATVASKAKAALKA